MCAAKERAERLERAGFTVHRTAAELREVRERFPARDDLARRLVALEEEARTLAGQVAMELRELEEVATRHPGVADPAWGTP